ncbi:hypothetical protein TNCV_430201 [Trichonephila clavipes]|nr:hypothetical protein TNCV_430201 [Trichonephila clavipes]
MHVKFVEDQSLHFGVVWKFGKRSANSSGVTENIRAPCKVKLTYLPTPENRAHPKGLELHPTLREEKERPRNRHRWKKRGHEVEKRERNTGNKNNKNCGPQTVLGVNQALAPRVLKLPRCGGVRYVTGQLTFRHHHLKDVENYEVCHQYSSRRFKVGREYIQVNLPFYHEFVTLPGRLPTPYESNLEKVRRKRIYFPVKNLPIDIFKII